VKKLMVLVVLLAIAFVVYNRQRVYVRDPLGSVTRDGVKERGAQVFINYSNDVLLENDNPPMYVTLVQHGQPVGTPAKIGCIHFVVCMTNADVAKLIAIDSGAGAESMSNTAVTFRDANGHQTVVTLR
jgi:hypothetical protein